jgi:NAD(P)-dependent dehydrogenase (short-subunit alcohol dehydrogenase family)
MDPLQQFRLDGKTALVAGVGPGMGAHVARAYAAAGANVVLSARSQDRLDSVAKEIEAEGGTALPVAADLGSQADIDGLVAAALDAFGGVDVLYYNAAGGRQPGSTPWNTTEMTTLDIADEWWEQGLLLNVLGPLRLARQLVPGMRERGHGSIIQVLASSAFATVRLPLAAYASTKSAMATAVRYLARDLGPVVRVNAISPGVIAADDEVAERQAPALSFYIERNAIPRYGLAREATGAALFLASEASSYITGQVIYVDGGHVSAG